MYNYAYIYMTYIHIHTTECIYIYSINDITNNDAKLNSQENAEVHLLIIYIWIANTLLIEMQFHV